MRTSLEAKRNQDGGNGFGDGRVRRNYDTTEEDGLWKDSLKLVGFERKVLAKCLSGKVR